MAYQFPYGLGESDAKLGGGFGLGFGGPSATNYYPDSVPGLSIGPFTATQEDEAHKYADGYPANYSINRSIAIKMPQTSWEEAKIQTVKGLPTFIREGKEQTLDMLPLTQPRSISLFNFMNETEHYRKTYGSQRSCRLLSQLWKMFGVPTHDLVKKSDAGIDSRLTMTVAGKAIVPNLWLAQGRHVEIGDHLFLMLRRHIYMDKAQALLEEAGNFDDDEDELVSPNLLFGLPNQSENDKELYHVNRVLETAKKMGAEDDDEPVVLPDFEDVGYESATESGGSDNEDAEPRRKKQKRIECHWSCDVWSSSDGVGPPTSMYQNEFMDGKLIRFARAGFPYGAVTDMDDAMMNAQRVLYPKTNDAAHIEAISTLPHLEIFLYI